MAKHDVKQGRLALEHNFSLSSRDSSGSSRKPATVLVDIYHVLDAIKADALQVGAWLNVFGYVRSEAQEAKENEDGLTNDVYVQAVMISEAGAIRVAEYEQSIMDMRAIDRRLRTG